jgi:hypothetical protein
MKVKITKLANNPMQSGRGKNNTWFLSALEQTNSRFIDKVTSRTSSSNTNTQLKLRFSSKECAIEYAHSAGLEYVIDEANSSTVKKKSYSSNFTAPVLT